MNFEINDGREHLPDEEDVYGVNDIEEQERFDALFGQPTQEDRVRRRKMVMRIVIVLLVTAFSLASLRAVIRFVLGY